MENNSTNTFEVTPRWIAENYDKLNRELFGGKLGPCRFGLFTTGKSSQKGDTYGWFKLNTRYEIINLRFDDGSSGIGAVKMKKNGTPIDWVVITKNNFFRFFNTPEILLSGLHQWTESAALSTLVHEMCHYYVNVTCLLRPKEQHGPEFKAAVRMVEQASNGVFSYERVYGSKDVDALDFSEIKRRRDRVRASKGIHVFMVEFVDPVNGCKYGYKRANASTYMAEKLTIIDNLGSYYLRAFDCVTKDERVYDIDQTNKMLSFWLTNDLDAEEDIKDLTFITKEELSKDAVFDTMKTPYYVLILKLLNKDGCEYFVAKNAKQANKLWEEIQWVFCDKDKPRAEYVSCFETHDGRMMGHKVSDPMTLTYWKAADEASVLPWCKRENYRIVYQNNTNSINETIYIREDDIKHMVREALQQCIKKRTM